MLDFRKKFLTLLFDENGKLNMIGITLYVDAMLLDKVDLLFTEIYQSAQNDAACLHQILRIYEARKTDFIKQKHGFFDAQLIEILSHEKIFQTYFVYEHEIDTILMSDENFELLTPTADIFIQNKIQFSWLGNIENLELIIENNRLEKKFKQKIANHFTLNLSSLQFAEGLYYFKLIKNEELIKLGKFYVFRP